MKSANIKNYQQQQQQPKNSGVYTRKKIQVFLGMMWLPPSDFTLSVNFTI